jgi:transcriptional regulator with XRE-family HTH domain
MTPLEARLAKGLTQEEAAAHLNISYGYISLLENGLRRPSFETMEKFSKFYGDTVKQEDWSKITQSGSS